MNVELKSERAPEPVGAYPHARKVGNFLFLSGVGPRKKGSKDIPGVTLNENGDLVQYDIALQCKSVFDNVRMIIEDCGTKFENIIDVTVFLTNIKDDFKIYNQIYKEYFEAIRPCRTTIEVNKLPTPIGIELKVLAIID